MTQIWAYRKRFDLDYNFVTAGLAGSVDQNWLDWLALVGWPGRLALLADWLGSGSTPPLAGSVV